MKASIFDAAEVELIYGILNKIAMAVPLDQTDKSVAKALVARSFDWTLAKALAARIEARDSKLYPHKSFNGL